jgi:starch phosphorylase
MGDRQSRIPSRQTLPGRLAVPVDRAAAAFQYDRHGLDAGSLRRSMANHLVYAVGKDLHTATERDLYHALAHAIRDRLIERWMETMRSYYREDVKRVYYLSLEFLIGRTLANSFINMGILEEARQALAEFGLDLERVQVLEPDAGLGNGGLGRLAACFLDSMATLGLPGYGFGIRYEYGMFRQRLDNGRQVEQPETWLRYGNPWEFPRPEVLYPVRFGGRVVEYRDEDGTPRRDWVDGEQVMAMAFDTPIPGFGAETVNNLRLWSAKATHDFDLKYFNEGNYIKAVEDKNRTEDLSRVLYPDDTTVMGRELRLKQEYFFVSASLQDIVHRYTKHHAGLDGLPEKVAIQLNDTHPALAIPELMRILVDDYGLPWERAWDLATRTFGYTNHTLMPEALETWPVRQFEALLPRHLQIIYEINQRFLEDVLRRYPGDVERLRRISILGEDGERHVRMSHLAFVGSHRVNGVSRMHTEIMRRTIFADLDEFFPGRIINITNGITPRRWLHEANPAFSRRIAARLGWGWITNLAELGRLEGLADDSAFQQEFRSAKRENKVRLAHAIRTRFGLDVPVDSMFDVQVKRIHEYKRQLLNVLHVIVRYNRLRANPDADVVPRVVVFAGKAAPGYFMAKLIIKLINDVADVVNNDPVVGDRLKVIFVPNYDVSTAAIIIPAAELSEQISTAGTEASGTGNMKLALNGALTIGTLDGANVEIRDAVGAENVFLFGLTAEEAVALRRGGYHPWDLYHRDPELRQALNMIGSGFFSAERPDLHRPVFDALTVGGDHFLLLADFASYVACQERVDALYRDPAAWAARAILTTSRMGWFSSDRTVREYAKEIWGATPATRASAPAL